MPGRPVISFYSILVVNNNDIALYIDIANNGMGDLMRIETNQFGHKIFIIKRGEFNA